MFESQRLATQKPLRELLELEFGDRSIYAINLSVRSYRRLLGIGVYSIDDLLKCSEEDLMSRRTLKGFPPVGFGVTSLNDVKQALDVIGLTLAGDVSG